MTENRPVRGDGTPVAWRALAGTWLFDHDAGVWVRLLPGSIDVEPVFWMALAGGRVSAWRVWLRLLQRTLAAAVKEGGE